MIGLVLFVCGVLGDLTAAWFQQDVLSSTFTPNRLALIFGLSLFGLCILALSDRQRAEPTSPTEALPRAADHQLSDSRFLWSKLKSRGGGIDVRKVFSFKSDIDIDTRSKKDKNGK
jgi:hypothetical protein